MQDIDETYRTHRIDQGYRKGDYQQAPFDPYRDPIAKAKHGEPRELWSGKSGADGLALPSLDT